MERDGKGKREVEMGGLAHGSLWCLGSLYLKGFFARLQLTRYLM